MSEHEHMRAPALLELKLNTKPVPFLLEVFRLCRGLQSVQPPGYLSPREVVRIEARVPGETRYTRDTNINTLSRQDVEKLVERDPFECTLLFHVAWTDQDSTRIHFTFELLDIGGTHPLLVRLLGHSEDLSPFAVTLLTRCLTLWDAQLVAVHRDGQRLVDQLLTSSESPNVIERRLRMQFAEAIPGYIQEHERVSQQVRASPAATRAEAITTKRSRKIREGTAADLEQLKTLFEAKKQGARSSLTWSRACDEAGTTSKTAGVYLQDIKAQWIAMDKARRKPKSPKPRKRRGRK
jgi:hypothetical protein